jgi:hypothetical protein
MMATLAALRSGEGGVEGEEGRRGGGGGGKGGEGEGGDGEWRGIEDGAETGRKRGAGEDGGGGERRGLQAAASSAGAVLPPSWSALLCPRYRPPWTSREDQRLAQVQMHAQVGNG